MVKVFVGTENEFYMDGYHKTNLDLAKKVIKQDWDMIFVYDGYEGCGKSVKAMQDAYYCDPTLILKRIVFNPDDFKEAVLKAKPLQAVVYDEAYGGLSSKGAMGKVNKSIVQMLTVIREKNLFIFIVLPTFFDLDKYVALWRSRALINIYSGEDFQRGFFKFYNTDKKKQLYVGGKKFYNYSGGIAKPNFRGRFTNHYVVDEKAYRRKKRETSVKINDDFNLSVINVCRQIKETVTRNLKEKQMGLTTKQKSGTLEVTEQTITKYLRERGIVPKTPI